MKLPTTQYPTVLHFVHQEPARLRKMLRQFDEDTRYRSFYYQAPAQLLGKLNLPKWRGRGMQLYLLQWEVLHETYPQSAEGFIRRLTRWIRPDHIVFYVNSKYEKQAEKLSTQTGIPYLTANVNFQHRLENFIKARQSQHLFTRLKRRMILLSILFLLLIAAVIFVVLFS